MKKQDRKQRLFEVTARLDKTFKPKLNEVSYANYVNEFQNLVTAIDNGQADIAKKMLRNIKRNDKMDALKAYLAEMGEYEAQSWITSNLSMGEDIDLNNEETPKPENEKFEELYETYVNGNLTDFAHEVKAMEDGELIRFFKWIYENGLKL